MADQNEKISQLLKKLEDLLVKQDEFSREIGALRNEINELRILENAKSNTPEEIKDSKEITEKKVETVIPVEEPVIKQESIQNIPLRQPVPPIRKPAKEKSNLEKFIGENLISKIGIIITILGVAIGAKYTIEKDLISPLGRIIIGYIIGLGLLTIGIKLKRKYANYSAVLVSGAMAIMYFITYLAYSLYDLFPQMAAFILMVVFTVITVLAAISYNRQVIAHIGMVGAYAVPFLLSDGSGNVSTLFTYIAIINTGILAISFVKYWKPLHYSAAGLTWLIAYFWYISSYKTEEHFSMALTFISIFFIIFYLAFLVYKIRRKEKFEIQDVLLLMSNSFIFYGIGYSIFDSPAANENSPGLFTLCNAVIHFIASIIIYRQKLADKNLFYLVTGLALIFITITIPVQLTGNWVTLLWAGEATLLFWIGRTKNVGFYEKISYPLMILATLSMIYDWSSLYHWYIPKMPETRITPFININFLSSVLFVVAFGLINFWNHSKKYTKTDVKSEFSKIFAVIIPTILIVAVYFTFFLEIANYWVLRYADSTLLIDGTTYLNPNLLLYNTVWLINYSLLFTSALAFINIRKFKSQPLGLVNLGLIVLGLAVFLTQGLYSIRILRESYLWQTLSQHFEVGIFSIIIRYISFAFAALGLFAAFLSVRRNFNNKDYKIAYDFLLHITILWVACSELINWMDIGGADESNKLGLSILLGIYSLLLIVLGIRKKKKHLRIGAIVLFSVTLIKVFFYDIAHLSTIAKTIVFVSLGILLLIISFLYTKYRHAIFGEDE